MCTLSRARLPSKSFSLPKREEEKERQSDELSRVEDGRPKFSECIYTQNGAGGREREITKRTRLTRSPINAINRGYAALQRQTRALALARSGISSFPAE